MRPHRLALLGAVLLLACGREKPAGDGGTGFETGAPETPADRFETGAPEAPADRFEAGAPEAPADRFEASADGGHCGYTTLHASVVVHLPNGDLSCSAAPLSFASPPTTNWVGKVTSSDATSLVVEGCAPSAPAGDGGAPDAGTADAGAADAGCTTAAVRIEAHAPGLDLTRFPKGWVRVRAAVSQFYACQQWLELTTADPTDGSPSQGPAGKLLLAVDDGNGVALDDSYKVAHVQLGCSPRRTCNGNATGADVYAFEFSETGGIGAPLRVYTGETAAWSKGGTTYTVRNLRSFQSEACDDYWNWAYTIYADPQ